MDPTSMRAPLDQRFLSFARIDPEELREQLAFGKGDGEILEWVNANSTTKPSEWQIAQWSTYIEQRAPGDVESREFFNEEIGKLGVKREDIQTWADLLELDDYVSYGAKP